MICTFYSYKGGVGRSMALANVADRLARRGLRVLMIDFDLEAPGLEKYFEISQSGVRSHLGLLDLLLDYKRSMSAGADSEPGTQSFRQLWKHFIFPVYSNLPKGCLDLLPAGRREGEQLAQYGLALRTFDWQDFYFNWEGEIFFKWLRQALLTGKGVDYAIPYDVVLIDSRTGVTEIGGICTYQLADAILMLCAANQQNVEGTRNMAQDFLSSRTLKLRGDRPLKVLVVPSRVEQHDGILLAKFRQSFDKEFPAESLGRWDLMIPYDVGYAFEERVPSQPGRKESTDLTKAFDRLAEAVLRLSSIPVEPVSLPGSPAEQEFAALEAESFPPPRHSLTQRFADWDAYLSYNSSDTKHARDLARLLEREGLRIFRDKEALQPGEAWVGKLEDSILHSRCLLFCLGHSGLGSSWQSQELRWAMEKITRKGNLKIIVVLFPGVDLDLIPDSLQQYLWQDFRGGVEEGRELARLVDTLRTPTEAPQAFIERGSPYPGLRPMEERDAGSFFGREDLLKDLLNRLREANFLAITGPSGSGKTSLVCAGLFPALRRGALPGSETWALRTVRAGSQLLAQLVQEIYAVYPSSSSSQLAAIARVTRAGGGRLVLFVDQFEEVFNLASRERRELIDNLAYASEHCKDEILILLGIRSDFIDQCTGHETLGPLLTERIFPVPPLSVQQLREAIEEPARRVGLTFEPGLVERILRGFEKDPGSLSLLQILLFQLWERRRDGWLTNSAYDEIGGLSDALARAAEETYQGLSPEEQEVARRVILSLVQPGESGGALRRRADLAELKIAGQAGDRLEKVVEKLVEARLLIADRSVNGITCLSLAHDSLLLSWQRLGDWINEDREFLLWRRRLQSSLRDWSANKQRSAGLLSGLALEEALSWSVKRSKELNTKEKEYILRSRKHRAWNKSQLLGILVIIPFFALMIYGQLKEESVPKADYQEALEIARKRSGSDQDSSDGRWAVRINHGYLELSDRRVRGAAFLEADSLVGAAVFSPDNKFLVVGEETGEIRFWNLQSGQWEDETVQAFPAIHSLAFDRTGRFLAVASDSEIGVIELKVQGTDIQSISSRFRPMLGSRGGAILGIYFNIIDGKFLTSIHENGDKHNWDFTARP